MREQAPTEPFERLKPFEQEAVESQDACAEACRRHRKCVQWMFLPEGRCYLGDVVRFGGSDEQQREGGGDGGQGHWVSGWMQERVQKFKSGFEGCEVRWHG